MVLLKVSVIPRSLPVSTPSYDLERRWTAEELVECDTTTLERQTRWVDGDRILGRSTEKLSDCEVAIFLANLATRQQLEALTDAERREFVEYEGALEVVRQTSLQVMEDGVLSLSERDLMCRLVDQHLPNIRIGREFSADRDLLKPEVEFLAIQGSLEEIVQVCGDR